MDFPIDGIFTRQDGTSIGPHFGTLKLNCGVAKPFVLDRETAGPVNGFELGVP